MILSAFGYLERLRVTKQSEEGSKRIRIMLDVHALGATYYHRTTQIMVLQTVFLVDARLQER